jgi:hypothetical protein
MIPPVEEVGVKLFLYDFKVDCIEEEGWNEASGYLGKRASVEKFGLGDSSQDKNGKKHRKETASDKTNIKKKWR